MQFIYRPSTRISEWNSTLPRESGYYKVLAQKKTAKGTELRKTIFYFYQEVKEWDTYFPEDKEYVPIVWWDWGEDAGKYYPIVRETEKIMANPGVPPEQITIHIRNKLVSVRYLNDYHNDSGMERTTFTHDFDLEQAEGMDPLYITWLFDETPIRVVEEV